MSWFIIEKFLNNYTFIALTIGMISCWLSIFFYRSNFFFNISRASSFVSNLFLFIHLGGRWLNAKYFPLSNLYESLLFLCWALLFGQILIENKTKTKLLAAINLPIVLLINLFASLTLPPEMQKILPLVPSLQSNWLMMHVTMMMISYATLLLGSLFSILYLFLSGKNKKEVVIDYSAEKSSLKPYISANQELVRFDELEISKKQKNNTTLLNREALLEILDLWSYRIIGLGFPFLTIGIISGGIWANEAWGSYWSWDPKETWALITWIVFAIYLHMRLTKGLKGKKTAFVGSLGFFVIWICYLGVNFLAKGLHSYGWLS